jgi:hypothetical protein
MKIVKQCSSGIRIRVAKNCSHKLVIHERAFYRRENKVVINQNTKQVRKKRINRLAAHLRVVGRMRDSACGMRHSRSLCVHLFYLLVYLSRLFASLAHWFIAPNHRRGLRPAAAACHTSSARDASNEQNADRASASRRAPIKLDRFAVAVALALKDEDEEDAEARRRANTASTSSTAAVAAASEDDADEDKEEEEDDEDDDDDKDDASAPDVEWRMHSRQTCAAATAAPCRSNSRARSAPPAAKLIVGSALDDCNDDEDDVDDDEEDEDIEDNEADEAAAVRKKASSQRGSSRPSAPLPTRAVRTTCAHSSACAATDPPTRVDRSSLASSVPLPLPASFE